MQIELNDDQVALLVDLISRNAGDIEFTRDQLEETMGDGLTGYAGVVLYQSQCRLTELQKTLMEQSGYNWVHNNETQRMEPRYKPMDYDDIASGNTLDLKIKENS